LIFFRHWRRIAEKEDGKAMNMLFVVLIMLAVVAVFSVQNAQPVAIKFLFWGTEASLAIVIIASVALGALLASVVALWTGLKHSRGAKKEKAVTKKDDDVSKPSSSSASE
jgi:uncharacterized integral membrane protein